MAIKTTRRQTDEHSKIVFVDGKPRYGRPEDFDNGSFIRQTVSIATFGPDRQLSDLVQVTAVYQRRDGSRYTVIRRTDLGHMATYDGEHVVVFGDDDRWVTKVA